MELHKQTLELQRRILGDDPDTLRSIYDLAKSYSHLDQHQEAMDFHKQTLELR